MSILQIQLDDKTMNELEQLARRTKVPVERLVARVVRRVLAPGPKDLDEEFTRILDEDSELYRRLS
jgi:predicted DNA-binding ribbon-helix-helix protein